MWRRLANESEKLYLTLYANGQNLPNSSHRKENDNPSNTMQGRIQGGPGPLFLAKSILFFYIVYNVRKKILKLNFDFIVAEIRGVFLEVWGCMRV